MLAFPYQQNLSRGSAVYFVPYSPLPYQMNLSLATIISFIRCPQVFLAKRHGFISFVWVS